jgi:hypothetical protein
MNQLSMRSRSALPKEKYEKYEKFNILQNYQAYYANLKDKNINNYSKSPISRDLLKIKKNESMEQSNIDNTDLQVEENERYSYSYLQKEKIKNDDNILSQMKKDKNLNNDNYGNYINYNKNSPIKDKDKRSANTHDHLYDNERYAYANNVQIKDKISNKTDNNNRKYSNNNTPSNRNSNNNTSSNRNSNNKSNHQSVGLNSELIKHRLKNIYQYYCQFGERMNTTLLKSHKFQKFVLDADIIDDKLTKTRVELIFTTENKTKNKTGMDFDNFLSSLIKLAEYKYIINCNDKNKYSNTSQSALQSLLKNYIFPLYDKLVNLGVITDKEKEDDLNLINTSTTIGNRTSIVNINIDGLILSNNRIEEVLKGVAPVIYDIYKVYFPWEISLTQNESFLKENSLKTYFVFLKDFDLCPSLISKSSSFIIYNQEIENKDYENNELYSNILKKIEINPLGKSNNKSAFGKHFTFVKLLKCLCRIGDHGFEKIDLNPKNMNNLSTIQKICLLFERMELSEGFLTIQTKTNKTNSKKTSFIIPKDILDKVKLGMKDKNDEDDYNVINNTPMNNDEENAELFEKSHRQSKLRKSVLGNFRDLCEHSNFIIEKFGNQLNAIFKFYCSFGDPMNTNYMKSKNFIKLLKEANLIKSSNTISNAYVDNYNNIGIKMNDVDVIFVKLTGISPSLGGNITSNNLNNSHISSCRNTSTNSSFTFSKIKRNSAVNSNAKIDFNGFINSIEIISLHIFPNKNELEAIEYIINNNILPLYDKLSYKNNDIYQLFIKEKTKNKEFADCLHLLNKALMPVYKFYMNKNGLMNFDSFLK